MRTLDRDWFGTPAPDGPGWDLRVGGNCLLFSAASGAPPIQSPDCGEGDFVEGLWEGDVAELFLLNPNTGYYLEFNLSPSGAWWCCAFDAPRVRVTSCPRPLPGVKAAAKPLASCGWESALNIPLASLPWELAFSPDSTMGNVTFCLGRPQRYFTAADLGAGQPDFHRPRAWPPLGKMLECAGCGHSPFPGTA